MSEVKFNEKYSEIFKLHNMLAEAGIPHDFVDETPSNNSVFIFPGLDCTLYHIFYPSAEKYDEILGPASDMTYSSRVCSVIEGWHSYGGEKNLLEIRGLLTPEEENDDTVRGWLTAENVFERIKAANESRKE